MHSVLQEPAYLPTETPRLPGLDGRRMAKSYGNAIWLSDPPSEIRTKVLKHMMTDPQRVRRTDPVSYTHLDVYKRQPSHSFRHALPRIDGTGTVASLSLIHILNDW